MTTKHRLERIHLKLKAYLQSSRTLSTISWSRNLGKKVNSIKRLETKEMNMPRRSVGVTRLEKFVCQGLLGGGTASTHPTSFFSELCWGQATVAYTKPQQRKKEESERLRGEREIRSKYG